MFREFTLSTLIREFMYFIPVITIVIFAIISDLISNLGKKENARAVSLIMLSIFTIGFCLLDKGYPHFGQRFIFYYVGCFAPLMLAYSLYTLYRSIKHYMHFRRPFAIILLINSVFIFSLSLVNMYVVWKIIKIYQKNDIISAYHILIVLGICSTIQFIVGELERKRVQKLLKQRKEDVVIQNPEATESESHEN